MNDIKILEVNNEDIDSCVETIRQAFLPKALEYGFTKENYPSSGAFIKREVLISSKNNGALLYCAWFDDLIVGYMQLVKLDNDTYSFQKFAVIPKYQQYGIGKILISFAKEKVKELNGNKITLIMVDKNTDLKNFYISNGFTLKKIIKDDKHPFEQAVMECSI